MHLLQKFLDVFFNSSFVAQQGFSVTPSLLSTVGSLSVISELRRRYGDSLEHMEGSWLDTFGVSSVWTEYTLYRLVLDDLGMFEKLHSPQQVLTFIFLSVVTYT